MSTPIPSNRARFTLAEIAEVTDGSLSDEAAAETEICGVGTDSRAVPPGGLFVALAGEHFDGHDFLEQLEGASAALVERGRTVPAGLTHVEVDDTLEALGCLAQAHRVRWGGRVVAITGSAGKTTTKELTAAALAAAGAAVAATRGNLNNLIGVPMTLLTLEDEDFAVIEMGTSAPGEIEALAAMVLPDVGVLTLVDAAHTAGIGSVDDVLVEKAALLAILDEDDTGVVNGDDARLRGLALPSRRLEYGSDPEADVCLEHFAVSEQGTRVRYRVAGEELTADLQLLGRGAALGGAAALAVVVAFDLDVAAAAAGLGSVVPVAGRLRLRRRADGLLIVDDGYNANPASMRLALETAAGLAKARGGALHAVLGDMLELGALERRMHQAVIRSARAHGAQLALVGQAMADVADGEPRFEDAASVRITPAAGDVVLVKGSRSIGLEVVVDRLLDEGGGEA